MGQVVKPFYRVIKPHTAVTELHHESVLHPGGQTINMTTLTVYSAEIVWLRMRNPNLRVVGSHARKEP